MIINSLMIPAAVILAALQGAISLVAQTGSPAAPLQQAASGACDAETDRFCGVRENADRFRAVYEKLENDTMAEIDAMMRTRTWPQIMKTHHDCSPFPSPARIPRTLKISSRRRKPRSASIVALTTFA